MATTVTQRFRSWLADRIAPAPLRRRASATAPYEAGSTGRRSLGWQASRLGATTLLWGNLDNIRSRSRDAVRNNPLAASAIDKFESNVIGSGIQPHWRHPDPQVRTRLQKAWERWGKEADFAGQSDFNGLLALIAREIFEAGEVFIRYRLRPPKARLFVPLQLQLIEGEQVPVFRNIIPSDRNGNVVRTGIEFDKDGRRVAYHMYKEHPGETMFFPLGALQFVEVPAEEIRHVYKPLRAGQLRGQPHMTAVLTLLYTLDKYMDAELVRKEVCSMFAGFITRPAAEDSILPPAPANPASPNLEQPLVSNFDPQRDIGTDVSKIEAGTLQQLFPGEDIKFPEVPTASDFESFVRVQAHRFAAGLNMTYEQLTSDLKGVTYSSIRAGVLEFQRACEQFQYNVIVHQACEPIKNRWLKEAVLSGALDIPGYFDDPTPYEEVVWVAPGWAWVDPLKESQAAQMDVRNGFSSRAMIARSRGLDPEEIDAQQAADNARAEQLGLVYDSNPAKVLIGRETNPTEPAPKAPRGKQLEEEEQQAELAAVSGVNGKGPMTRRPQ